MFLMSVQFIGKNQAGKVVLNMLFGHWVFVAVEFFSGRDSLPLVKM